MIENQTIYNEMLAHVPVCTHRRPENVLVLGDVRGDVTMELTRHVDIENVVVVQSQVCEIDLSGHSHCSVVTQESVAFLSEAQEASFDVVIITADINDPLNDQVFYGLINRVLKSDGVVAVHAPSSIRDAGSFEDMALKLGEYFKIVMPSFYPAEAGLDNLLLASKKYHPTADIILQRGDLIENLQYYNCDIQLASFVLPNYIKARFGKVLKV